MYLTRLMLGRQVVSRRSLRAVRGFSSAAGSNQSSLPSTGTLAGVIVLINTAGFGFAAYQCNEDPKLEKRVSDMPVFGSVVVATKDLLLSSGVLKTPAGRSSDSSVAVVKNAISEKPAAKAAKKPVEKSKAKKDMAALIEASRTKNSEGGEEAKSEEKEEEVQVVNAKESKAVETPAPVAAEDGGASSEAEAEPVEEVKAVAAKEVATEEKEVATDAPQEPAVVVKDYSTLPPVPAEARAMAISANVNHAVGSVMDELNSQTIDLRKELEATLLADLDKLDAPALRMRCTQLAAEFFERTKWEGVRLHANVKQVKSEVGKEYADRMVEQRAELELELNKRLLEREADLMAQASVAAKEQLQAQEGAFERALKEQAQGFTNQITMALEHNAAEIREEVSIKANNEIAVMRDEHVQQQLDMSSKINNLQAHVSAFDGFADKIVGLTSDSANAHKFSAAVMALEGLLQRNEPMADAVKAVKTYCKEDPLVQALSNSLPPSLLQSGAPSFLELKIRFMVVKDHVRQSAFAPEGLPEVVGQAVGSFLSKIYWAPTGPVDGSGAEEVLSRASHALDQGRLDGALKELEGIKGYGNIILTDWAESARNRLIADQAVQALRAAAVVKHQQMSKKEKK